MTGTRSDTWEARLDILERSNLSLVKQCRRWRRAGIVAAAGLAVLLVAGANSLPGMVEASNFVLRDKAGRMRAALAIRPDGTPGLGLFDEDGRPRVSIDLGAKGVAGVNLLDGAGRTGAALAIRPDGTPGLGLFDPAGRPRLSLDVDPAGRPGVNVYGDDGRLRAALAIRPDGTPGLGLFDNQGNPGTSLEEDRGGAPPRPVQGLH